MNSIFAKISSPENISNSLFAKISSRENNVLYSIWRSCWFLIFGGRWEYFTILFAILTDENVGIDTKTKSVDGLIRKMFVFE